MITRSHANREGLIANPVPSYYHKELEIIEGATTIETVPTM